MVELGRLVSASPGLGWPALSDGRKGEGIFGRRLMVLVVFGSFWSFSFDFDRFPMVFVRFRPVRGTGERASQPPPEHKPVG